MSKDELDEIEALEELGIEPDENEDEYGTLERADDYMDIYYHDLANK